MRLQEDRVENLMVFDEIGGFGGLYSLNLHFFGVFRKVGFSGFFGALVDSQSKFSSFRG